ncbi:unnamed protein product [Meganyctiphanes norvegica]|uniref:Uncharacterized protein n=1 Tax=Meganyctiphanes norvegica TaxID=48144 RepID=A0AAV2QS07_MEGNR
MHLKFSWTTLLFFLGVLAFGQTRHCYLSFILNHHGASHTWEFMSVSVGHSQAWGCHDTVKDCGHGAQGWTDNFLGQTVPPVNTGNAAKILCEHFNTVLLPTDQAIVHLHWKPSSCDGGETTELGQLCCSRDKDGLIVPNDGCQIEILELF